MLALKTSLLFLGIGPSFGLVMNDMPLFMPEVGKPTSFLIVTADENQTQHKQFSGVSKVMGKTVMYIAASKVDDLKLKLFAEIVKKSPVDVVVGVDHITDADFKMLDKLAESGEFQTLAVQHEDMVKKYGEAKSRAFGGKHGQTNGKLSFLDWFSGTDYDFAWHVEDDVWMPGLPQLLERFRVDSSDLVVHASDGHPFWAKTHWLIAPGQLLPQGEFCYAELMVHRVSKRFATNLLQSLKNDKEVSHHEIYYPYIADKYKMTWSNLHSGFQDFFHDGQHPPEYSTNYGQDKAKMTCLQELQKRTDVLVAHPVKTECQ